MITRSAIIISCPGQEEHYLRGAAKDVKNMCNYLMSPRGGDWKTHEIFCLNNPAWLEVKKLLDRCTADYQFIYFAGHGFSDKSRKRFLTFKDQSVEDIRLFTHNNKQLIIADSCRTQYATISGIPPADDVYSNFTGESDARIAFDDAIRKSENGKMIVYATIHDNEAKEERFGRGGAFTLSLLVTTQNFKTGLNLCPVMINDLLPTVKEILLSQKYTQTPEVVYRTGNLRVPFLIDIEQLVVDEESVENQYISMKPKSNPSLFKAIAITMLLILIIRGISD